MGTLDIPECNMNLTLLQLCFGHQILSRWTGRWQYTLPREQQLLLQATLCHRQSARLKALPCPSCLLSVFPFLLSLCLSSKVVERFNMHYPRRKEPGIYTSYIEATGIALTGALKSTHLHARRTRDCLRHHSGLICHHFH